MTNDQTDSTAGPAESSGHIPVAAGGPAAVTQPPKAGRRHSTGMVVGAGVLGLAIGAFCTAGAAIFVWAFAFGPPPPPPPPPGFGPAAFAPPPGPGGPMGPMAGPGGGAWGGDPWGHAMRPPAPFPGSAPVPPPGHRPGGPAGPGVPAPPAAPQPPGPDQPPNAQR